MFRRYYPTVVGIAIVWHILCAAALYIEPAAINATALFTMLIVVRDITGSVDLHLSAFVFAAVALLAFVGMFVSDPYWRIGLIIWQHIILWVSATGALHAMYIGQFADGVTRPRGFLIVDQSPVVLIALAHAVAICIIASEGRPVNDRKERA